MEKNRRLNKVLNTGDILVTAFGAMIGWGWVVSSGEWIQSAGALGTVLGFLIGGFMIYFVGLVYAELTTAIPEVGGPKVFTEKAFGRKISFVTSWSIIMSYIGVVCFEACSLPTIIQYIFPGFLKGYLYTVAGFDIYASWLIVGIVFAIAITYLNILGIKTAVLVQKILTITIALVGIILVAISTVNGSPTNLENQIIIGETTGSAIKNIMSIAVVAPFFLFGFDVIPQAAEEINVPLKKLGRLLIGSIALAVIFYGLVVLAVGYGMNSAEISNSVTNSGLVTADAMAKLFNSGSMAKVLIIGGLCGIITSWNSFLMGGSRIILAMSEAKMIPSVFNKVSSKRKTPINALLLVGAISLVSLFFGRVMLVWISNVASFACCLSYCIVSVAFLKLRKTEPQLQRPFKVKKYKLVGSLAIILSGMMCLLYLIPGSGSAFTFEEFVILGVWVLIGVLFVVIGKFMDKKLN